MTSFEVFMKNDTYYYVLIVRNPRGFALGRIDLPEFDVDDVLLRWRNLGYVPIRVSKKIFMQVRDI